MDYFTNLLSSNFMPHGHCFFWRPEILWPQVLSNLFIALAYCSIPTSLIYIFRKRDDFKFIWMMILFAIFIFGCGLTHVFDIILIWNPIYRLDAIIRVITALASIGTALVLVKITPDILKIPTTAEWQRVNQKLQAQLKELKEKDQTIAIKQEFEFLAELMPQLVWITLPNGDHFYFNERWYDYTGFNFDDSKNAGWSQVLHPDDYENTLEIWNKSLQTHLPYEIEYRLKSRTGEYKWFLARAMPMKNEDGTVIKWFGTCTEIHDQKIKNEELIKINNDLDNFVYTASHDLLSPVNNMEGLMTMLKNNLSKNKIDEIQSTISFIDTSVVKLKSTIDDLTKVAKVQKDEIAEYESIDIEELFHSTLNELNIEEEVEINVDFKFKSLKFSKSHVRSILYNLLSNAIKYKSPSRKLKLLVSSEKRDNFFVLSVHDNGLGLPQNQLSKIFQMFKRYYSHVSGTGIGLYLVKRIVENNGGRVEVESVEGEGSTFRVFIKQ